MSLLSFYQTYADHIVLRFSYLLLLQLDCFHPSSVGGDSDLIGHQNMAKVIWNNILSPAYSEENALRDISNFCTLWLWLRKNLTSFEAQKELYKFELITDLL